MHAADPTPSIFTSPRFAEEMVGMIQEPFAVLDGDLRLVAASPAFFLRFALSQTGCIGSRVYDLGAGEWDTPGARELFETLAPRRESVEGYSLEVRGSADKPSRVQVSIRPVREGQNTVRGYLLSFAEIDPAPIPASAQQFQTVRHQSGDLVVSLESRSLRIVHVEGAGRELTGTLPHELLELNFDALLHTGEREGVLTSLAGLRPGEPQLRITFRMRHRDLRYVWVEAHCHASAAESGPPLIQIVARDVSERKRAEEALRWLGRQTKLILDSAPDGIFGVDSPGNITFINPAAARALGYRVPELLGRAYSTLVPDDDSSAHLDVISETLEDGLGRTVADGMLRSADGSGFPVEFSCSAAKDNGVVTGAVVTFRPIAERKRAQEAALNDRWLAGVGETTVALRHEINNPLTTLLAEARLLEMGDNTRAEEREMVAAICTEARRIGDVIRKLAERQAAPAVRIEGTQRMLDLK